MVRGAREGHHRHAYLVLPAEQYVLLHPTEYLRTALALGIPHRAMVEEHRALLLRENCGEHLVESSFPRVHAITGVEQLEADYGICRTAFNPRAELRILSIRNGELSTFGEESNLFANYKNRSGTA